MTVLIHVSYFGKAVEYAEEVATRENILFHGILRTGNVIGMSLIAIRA